VPVVPWYGCPTRRAPDQLPFFYRAVLACEQRSSEAHGCMVASGCTNLEPLSVLLVLLNEQDVAVGVPALHGCMVRGPRMVNPTLPRQHFSLTLRLLFLEYWSIF